MSSILVSGLINIEVTLRVDRFPIEYSPVRYPFHGVGSTVSGVGYNIAKALMTLGDDIHLLSIIGRDANASLVRSCLDAEGVSSEYVLSNMKHTPQSVILYDAEGRRQINVDLKDVQEQVYPEKLFDQALDNCELAVLCNVNYSRPLLRRAKAAGIPIATDVHTIANLHDVYNRDFLAAADILFMSDELLPDPPQVWVHKVLDTYAPKVVVIGLGAKGVLLGVRNDGFVERIPAVRTRPIISTIGAGDALFSAFVHYYCRDRDPYGAIQKAIVFAAHKTGAKSASEGFLSEPELERLYDDLAISGKISPAWGASSQSA